jgi:hypothetical protein
MLLQAAARLMKEERGKAGCGMPREVGRWTRKDKKLVKPRGQAAVKKE